MDYFIYILKNFRFRDFLDILIVSILLYRFLILLRGTRSTQLLVGTSLVVCFYWASITYELNTINWLLNGFFDYFFVFLIIIFQDQIKSALTEIGQSSLFRKKKRIIYEEEIEEIVNACQNLERDRLGALIVIERTHGLFNYSKTGTRVNAEIHSDIIQSFFQSTSALHDGAMIMFNHKIQAAGCFLPLSKSAQIDKKLGTRHRAALGLSEVSDAVIVCLSEETGRISIAYKGSFIHLDDLTTLNIKLYELLYSKSSIHKDFHLKASR